MKKLLFLFAAVMAWMLPAQAGSITDVITASAIGVTGTNSYGNYTGVSISSAAVYSANCAQNTVGAIQLRSSNNNSGIVSTTSGGTVKTVTITWDSGTAAGRTVQVYGSNTAYTAATALYGNDKGTLIADVNINDANDGVSVVTVTDDYEYVGIRSKSNALYLTSVAVEWETVGAIVAKPTFSPAAGAVKAGTEVTIACSTDDANIYYTTDGTEPTSASTVYSAPIAINDDVTIKAIAYVGTTASAVATAAYTVLPSIEDLNALSDVENNAQFVVGMDLNVVYANGQYNYVYDGTSYGLVYKDIQATAGQKIEAGWSAKMSIFKNLPEIVPLEAVTLVAGGTIPEPVEVTADDAAQTLSANNVNGYFCLMGVEIEDFGTGTTFTGKMDDVEVTFFKRFSGIEYPEAGKYNVIGFVSIYESTIQFYPTEFINAVQPIDSFNAMSDLEEGMLVTVGMPVTVVDPRLGEFVISWDGQRYGSVFLEDVELQAGDVLSAGWPAMYTMGELVALDPESVEVTAGGTVPATPEFGAEDLAQSQYDWSYATLKGVVVEDEVESWDAGMGVAIEGDTEAPFMFMNYLDPEDGEISIEAGAYNMTGAWIPGWILEPASNAKIKKPLKEESELPAYIFMVLAIEEAESDMPVLESLNAITDIENNTIVEVGMPLTVAATTEVVDIVYDGQMFGAIAYYGAQELAAGDVINAGWIASVYEGVLQAGGEVTLGEATEAPAAVVTPAEDLAQSQYPWSYIKAKNVTLEEDFEYGGYVSAEGAEFMAMLFSDETIPAGSYDLTGFWMPTEFLMGMSAKMQREIAQPSEDYLFIITAYEEATPDMPVLENLTAVSDIEDNTIVEVGMPLTIAATTGIVDIVYDGASFGAIAYYGAQELEPGDVVEAGWNAVVVGGALMAGGEITLGEATEAPAPIVVTGDDLNQTMYPWSYVTIQNVLLFDDLEDVDVAYAYNEDGDLVPFYAAVFSDEGIPAALYNMTGFWMPIEFLMALDEDDEDLAPSEDYLFVVISYESANNDPIVENLTALADFEEMQHFTMGCELTCIYYADGAGVFTDGTSNIMLAVDGDYKPGDVLATGWTAVYMGPGIQGCFCLSDDAPEVVDTVEPIVAPQCPAEDIDTQKVKDLNYVTLVDAYAYDEEVEICELTEGEELNVYVGETEQVETLVLNYFGVDMPTEEGKYNIVGFWAKFEMGGISPYDEGDDEEDAFYFFIPVSFERIGSTGIAGIELGGNATYYDLNGIKIANPRAGKAYIRVIDGKATKVVK